MAQSMMAIRGRQVMRLGRDVMQLGEMVRVVGREMGVREAVVSSVMGVGRGLCAGELVALTLAVGLLGLLLCLAPLLAELLEFWAIRQRDKSAHGSQGAML